MQPLMSSTNTT
ncbi:hypothetical protein D049_3082A, partial [Vibrio parahaemolyticus VPTS-2010]